MKFLLTTVAFALLFDVAAWADASFPPPMLPGASNAILPAARTALNLGPYAAPEDYNGSGSNQATTGSIAGGSKALTLASALDFKPSQGILVCGAGVTQTGAAPSGLTVTPHGTLQTTSYAYRISTDDGNGGLSAAITAVSIANGNASLSATNYNALSWTLGAGASRYQIWVSKNGGAFTYLASTALTTYNDTGATYAGIPFWVPATPNAAAQADFLVSSITTGAGLTGIILAASASNAVSAQCVRHDDTVALQAAITAAASDFSYFYPSGTIDPAYQIPAVQLADGKKYNISSALTTTASLAMFSRSNAIIEKAGYLGNSVSSSSLNRLAIQNVTFAGGARSLSIGNSNIDDTLYWLDHVEFLGTTDYAIFTTGDYSAHLQCYACNFVGTNGAISSDADLVTVHAGWSETHFLWFQLNRAWFAQTHTNYYNQIWNIDDHAGVPFQSDGVAYVQGNRWLDLRGTAHLYGNRWGGEQAGIPVVYIQSTISTATTPQLYQGPAIDIRGGWNFCGPTSGMTVNGCVVLNGVPASVSFDSTAGPAQVPIVTDNIGGGGFAAAVTTFRTAAGIADARPYIEFSLRKGAARSAAWPPPGSLWPNSINTYLRDYHASGTFVPTLKGTTLAGSPTYTTQLGWWEQNNGTVTVHVNIVTSALGGPTGNMQIGALPVAADADVNERGSCMIADQNGVTLDTGFTQFTGLIQATATAIDLWEFKSAGGNGTATPVTDYAAATRLTATCVYPAWH